MTSLPQSIGQLSQLQELDLRENQFSSLPEAIWQLSQLQELDLRGNLFEWNKLSDLVVDSIRYDQTVAKLLQREIHLFELKSMLSALSNTATSYFDEKKYPYALRLQETRVLFAERGMEDSMKRADIQPAMSDAYAGLAFTYLYNQLFEKAEETAKKALTLAPKGYGNTSLIRAYVLQGKVEEAKAHFEENKDMITGRQDANLSGALLRQLKSMEEAGVFEGDNEYVEAFRAFLEGEG